MSDNTANVIIFSVLVAGCVIAYWIDKKFGDD